MVTLTVNGAAHEVDVDPETPLLYVLRNDLGLHAAKFGCGLGQCGSCTVMIDGAAVMSCVIPILMVEGRAITTLEGLGTADAPGPMQQAFIEEQAAQCGYCIPGMMMRAQALLERNPAATEDEVRAELEPNLCRCGTHMRIIRAIMRAGASDAAARARACGYKSRRRDMNASHPHLSRRAVLAGGGALVVSFSLAGNAFGQVVDPAAAPPEPPKLPGSLQQNRFLDSWIRVDADGTITVFTGKAELGQGIRTALMQVAAEELGIEPVDIDMVTADTARSPDEGYTAGSQSMQNSGTAIRNAAAQVRELIIAEAARRWNVSPADLRAEKKTVVAPGGRTATFGELVAGLMLHVEASPQSKFTSPDAFRVMGKPLPRVDIPGKVTGGVAYVQDFLPNGVVHARVVRPDSPGARLISVDTASAEKMPGVSKSSATAASSPSLRNRNIRPSAPWVRSRAPPNGAKPRRCPI